MSHSFALLNVLSGGTQAYILMTGITNKQFRYLVQVV